MLIAMLDDHCLECNTQLTNNKKEGGTTSIDTNEPLSGFDFVYLQTAGIQLPHKILSFLDTNTTKLGTLVSDAVHV